MSTVAGRPAAAGPGASGGTGRLESLDVVRAFAALAVLGVHAYALGGRSAPIKAEHLYDIPLISLAYGVWLFFALSGYVIGRPWIDRLLQDRPLPELRGYLVRRALRIFPLYWVALAALIALVGAGGAAPLTLVSHVLLVNNLVPGRQEALFPAAWTLTLELLFYLAVPALAWWMRARRRGGPPTAARLLRIIGFTWLLSFALNVAGDLAGDGTAGLWLRFWLPAMWQMFCPGLMLATAAHLAPDHRARRALVRDRRVAAAAVLLVTAGCVLGSDAPLRFGVVPYQLLVDLSRPLMAAGFGLLLARIVLRPPAAAARPARLWRELGLISYGIYLLHPVIEEALLKAGVHPGDSPAFGDFLLNVLALAALAVAGAAISWRLLEQPLIALGRSLSARWQPPAPLAAPEPPRESAEW